VTTTTTSIDTTTTATTVATTLTPTTTAAPTTTIAAGSPSPINGLPVPDPALLNRRVLAVKIDNHRLARPQSGIQTADAVYELMVEGITRFILLFQQSDTEYVGPIRSTRPTDGELLDPLDATFAISGGQAWVREGVAEHGVHIIGETRPAMFRVDTRSAPHNLYGDTNLLRAEADRRGFPDVPPVAPLWTFADLPPGSPATVVDVDFGPGDLVTWTYDGTSYLRSSADGPFQWEDEAGQTGPVAADVLVVMMAEAYTATPPGSGKPVPAMHTVGSGEAMVFAGGQVVEGTWARDTADVPFTLTAADGSPLTVPPGREWISIVPDTRTVDFRP
jgi:hypothetical protein